jgi:hypothetical protein
MTVISILKLQKGFDDWGEQVEIVWLMSSSDLAGHVVYFPATTRKSAATQS